MNRRDFFKFASIGILAGASLTTTDFAFGRRRSKSLHPLDVPRSGRGVPRIVVVGGGWSGLTVAKYLKKYAGEEGKDVDVVLIEKRDNFFSCPVSNLFLVDMVPLEFLVYDYQYAADTFGYHYVKATVYYIDRRRRIVYTDRGYIHYDYLVLAPGIDYEYSIWIEDPVEREIARTRYPAAFKPGSEHLALKRKIHDFEGGTFVLTVPPGLDYRCLPGPYERATLIAWFFKQNRIKGKVILVDEHPDPPVKAEGFHFAWDNYVKGYLEYYPNAGIKKVIPSQKKIITETYGEINFDDGSIYPYCKAPEIVFRTGLVPKGDIRDPRNRWADIHPLYYMSRIDERIFVSGDSRNQPFSKSGNTSNSEAKYVARVVYNVATKGELPQYRAPETLCYSAVAEKKAIWIDLTYKWIPEKKTFKFWNVKMDNKPSTKNYMAYMEWAKGLYRDMLGYANEPM